MKCLLTKQKTMSILLSPKTVRLPLPPCSCLLTQEQPLPAKKGNRQKGVTHACSVLIGWGELLRCIAAACCSTDSSQYGWSDSTEIINTQNLYSVLIIRLAGVRLTLTLLQSYSKSCRAKRWSNYSIIMYPQLCLWTSSIYSYFFFFLQKVTFQIIYYGWATVHLQNICPFIYLAKD